MMDFFDVNVVPIYGLSFYLSWGIKVKRLSQSPVNNREYLSWIITHADLYMITELELIIDFFNPG